MKNLDPALAARQKARPARHSAWSVACFVVVAALFLSAPRPAAAGEEHAWITVGADGWLALREEDRFRDRGEPLVEIDRRAGVVLTRVRVGDLAHISGFLHRALNRCAGFMRHASLADAHRALASHAEPPARGAQTYTIDQPAAVAEISAALDKPRILETIERLSTDFNNRYHQHPSGVAAAEWIRDQWAGHAAGRSDVTVDLVYHPGINQPSVVLTIAGATQPEQVVVLGGHLDSISSNGGPTSSPTFIAPGADDNASGIAVLSEVLRAAMEVGFRPQRTVSFMGYAAEEIGLVGSQDIAAQYAAAGTDVVAVLQLDMTDYNGSVEDMGLLSDNTDSTLTGFVADLVDTYQPELAWAPTACGYPCSDHASWHAQGYPAAMSFEAKLGEHNPFIHSISDTLATLGNSVDHAFKFARLAAAFLAEVAKPAESLIFADGFESGDVSSWSSAVRGLPGVASEIQVQSANVHDGAHAARLTVDRSCTDGDHTVSAGPISSDPAVTPCGELTANGVTVESGDVRFRAGSGIGLDQFSVAAAASFAAVAGEEVLGAAYVRDESPAAVTSFSARFHVDPTGLALASDTESFDHLVAYDGDGDPELLVGVTHNPGLGEHRLFVTAFESDGTARTTRGAGACELVLVAGWQEVMVHWHAAGASDGDVTLSVGGGAALSLTDCLSLAGGLDNGDGEISAVEWGAKDVAGESLGSLDMDDFDSAGD